MIINSSTRVLARNASIPRRTRSGEPTTDSLNACPTPASSVRVATFSMSSTGGGSRPGVPRRRFTKLCCNDVNNRCASGVVSAATTPMHAIAYGSANSRDGRNSRRYAASASSNRSGAKCDANANGSPSAAATRALNKLDPSSHTGTSSPAPGTACTV